MLLVSLAGCGTFELSLEPTSVPGETAANVQEPFEGTALPVDPDASPPAAIEPTGSDVEITAAPGFYEIAISWSGEMKGECQTLHINYGGQAGIGACKQSFREMIPLEGQFDHAEWWPRWLERFTSFQAATPHGQIALRGNGNEAASPAWQRAVAIWAELVWVELETGGRSESWITALSLNREMPGQPATCQSLQVTVYGLARAGTAPCSAGEPEATVEGWLETAEWDRFDAWYYSKAPTSNDGLDFYGVGLFDMSENEIVELHLWAEAVFNRLILNDLMEPTG